MVLSNGMEVEVVHMRRVEDFSVAEPVGSVGGTASEEP